MNLVHGNEMTALATPIEAIIKAERLLYHLRDQLGYLRWFMDELADQKQFAKLAIYAGDGTFNLQDGARREGRAISESCKEISQTIDEMMAAIGKFRGPCPICEGRTWLDEPKPAGRMQWDCRGHND